MPVATGLGRRLLGSDLAGVHPPIAGGLARNGDHRVDHHQLLNGDPIAHERRGESTERSCDQYNVGSCTDGVHDEFGVSGRKFPAVSSSPGRSTAIASCPPSPEPVGSRPKATHRPPGTRTNVLTADCNQTGRRESGGLVLRQEVLALLRLHPGDRRVMVDSWLVEAKSHSPAHNRAPEGHIAASRTHGNDRICR
jgi:hypothetical protein